MQVTERICRGRLGFEQGAELRLTARPLQKDDVLARDAHGELAVMVVLHQCQRQIDSGGHASRGPDRAVPHEDCIRFHGDRRIARPQRAAMLPVRDDPPAVQQAGLRQQVGPGADGTEPAGAGAMPGNPGDQFAILQGSVHRVRARYQERIDLGPGEVPRPPAQERNILIRDHRPALDRHDLTDVAGCATLP